MYPEKLKKYLIENQASNLKKIKKDKSYRQEIIKKFNKLYGSCPVKFIDETPKVWMEEYILNQNRCK